MGRRQFSTDRLTCPLRHGRPRGGLRLSAGQTTATDAAALPEWTGCTLTLVINQLDG